MLKSLALAGFLPLLCAYDWKALKPQGYVSDFARVVDPKSRAEIERYGADLVRKTGVQIALVTVRSLEGEPIEDVANTLFRAWGVGQREKNDGILLLLAVGERRSRLEVGYGLEALIPDGMSGGLLREMRPALRQNHYGEALLAAAGSIGSRIAQARGIALDSAPVRRIQREDSFPPILLIVLLVVLGPILLAVLYHFFPFFLGGLAGRLLHAGVSHPSGGGFGGFDSSDSFGGFGGGDSGGGGASSDW